MVRSNRKNAHVESWLSEAVAVVLGTMCLRSSFIRIGLVIWYAVLFQIGVRLASSYIGARWPCASRNKISPVSNLEARAPTLLAYEPSALWIFFRVEKKKWRFSRGPALLETR